AEFALFPELLRRTRYEESASGTTASPCVHRRSALGREIPHSCRRRWHRSQDLLRRNSGSSNREAKSGLQAYAKLPSSPAEKRRSNWLVSLRARFPCAVRR